MINTITFNPAMDKILYVEKLTRNFSNRIKKVERCLGGKGTHLSCNLGMLGIENRSFGVAMGGTGKEVLDELQKFGVQTHYVYLEEGETRTNYLVVDDDGTSTFLNERGDMLQTETIEKLVRLIDEKTEQGDVLVVAGDASNVEDKEVMLNIVRAARKKDMRLYLDCSGAFLRSAVQFDPFLIKPNMEELSELAEKKIESQAEAIDVILKLKNIPAVMLSMGGDGWIFKYKNKLIRGYGLCVPVGNVVGCGDALLTGLMYGFEYAAMELDEMLKFATALSATCAMSNRTLGFDVAKAKKMSNDVKLEYLK